MQNSLTGQGKRVETSCKQLFTLDLSASSAEYIPIKKHQYTVVKSYRIVSLRRNGDVGTVLDEFCHISARLLQANIFFEAKLEFFLSMWIFSTNLWNDLF